MRKKYQKGFILNYAFCNVCKVEFLYKFNPQFFTLAEKLFEHFQDRHDDIKPVSCNGNLSVIYSPAMEEIQKI